ncbi:MAG TPA: acetate/propionate family kinase [Jatrophihabitans sp.]|jgi:acetate kinase|uniref:acetate/propionate family kinase n=1 Tax=Jatrophihabitans sp. TaxID=1932789 RepID=UPI002DFDD27F|nr:acetate/propionate family kinase [Jatrophihabitans sp.]
MLILIVNAGSSSLKLRLLDDADEVVHRTDLPANAGGFDVSALHDAIADWPRPDVVSHRVVHGGERFRSAVRIDAEVEQALRDLTDLAPLHQPKSLAGFDVVSAALPDIAAVACFDTAFHATLSPAAYTYAVPAEWREKHGVRRYGFHGLSHGYAARHGAGLAGLDVSTARIVTAHLGAGASLTAVVGGQSVDTTMGFTPLEGLVMATRSGSVDPGLVLWLEEHENLSPHEVAVGLEEKSGVLGLTGTADLREVEERAAAGDADAQLAVEIYVHHLIAGIAAMAASADGIDLLVFTGGVGEHSVGIRRAVAERLAWLGLAVDDAANAGVDGDADISAAGASVRCVVVEAREDIAMADQTRRLVRGGPE